MAAFASESPFAAAYNPMSSFRLLRSHAAAEAHLRCTAAALRAGGIYVLDLELAGRSGAPPPTTDEAWEMTRGGVTVRAENDSIRVRDGAVERVLAWGLEGHLRAYTAAAFARRVEAAGAFEIESWHPESRRAGDVSVFDVERMLAMPGEGRGMVVLRKREQPGASPGIVAP
jgi:hypothetical protein